MILNLHVPVEKEAKLREAAAAAGQDVETFVLNAVDERLSEEVPTEPRLSKEDFQAWLDNLIAMHPQVTHFVDDSRESIYEGRGE
ncbi:MAG: hypothetical protein DCC68_24200 [Planctomycetota bacterium]|nr:MAG: hypothetical protein DCC68_24200 [Planctomycetota bacterium]